MKLYHPKALQSAQEYTGTSAVLEVLGWGVGGAVFVSPANQSALKVHLHRVNFDRELAVYRHLARFGVHEIMGFSIPQLIDADERLLIVEMSTVRRPWLLDFASSYLTPPDFDDEIMTDWWQRVEDRFGERFAIVREIYDELVSQFGIYYLDPKPGNIEFGD